MSTGFLALLDDLATILDDVAVMTKATAKKTAGVVGDDLALNANQITNITPNRELPVIFQIFKGSLINKLILVPSALFISFFFPFLITPLLMIGGAYLCFEGAEKIHEKFFHKTSEHQKNQIHQISIDISNPKTDILEFEKTKIKSAIKTDFILSAEIIAITLGIVSSKPMTTQAIVLFLTGIIMTFVIYGLVAAIVRIDDLGLFLKNKQQQTMQSIGAFLINITPKLMKTLSFVGTAAMFLVGGEIIIHGIPFLNNLLHSISVPLVPSMTTIAFGLSLGFLIVSADTLIKKMINKSL